MYDGTKYFARSLDSYHPSQSEVSAETEPDNPIKYGMVFNPTCDEELTDSAETSVLGESEGTGSQTSKENAEAEKLTRKIPYEPQIMIIYEAGDIHSALHCLIDSAQNPFERNAIAMVFIEEKIIDEVVQKILSKLKPLSDLATQHQNFWDSVEYIKTSELKTVTVSDDGERTFPVFVYDVTHEKLGNEQTGVITLHSFTKNEEVIDKYQMETLPFKSVCLWNETLDGVYEIVAALKCPHFYINCCNANLDPIQNSLNAGKNDVVFEDGFHYETITIYTLFKLIVFPIGDAIVAKPSAAAKEVEPISFLEP